jgi:hypothetical protein
MPKALPMSWSFPRAAKAKRPRYNKARERVEKAHVAFRSGRQERYAAGRQRVDLAKGAA